MRRTCNLILSICVLATITLLAALARPAAADGKFHRVPAVKKADHAALQLRVVSYDGAVNGALTVEVKNTGKVAATFSAEGLYFVPDGDPDRAPQRLGAVGPMQLAAAGDAAPERKDRISVAAGATVQVTLDVFCIDSHRDAPTSETPFTIARARMPTPLATGIQVAGSKAADEAGGYAAPAAMEKIQESVWETRDAKWIKLDGEGKQEAAK
ncbi:MAG TPA: hypothetical protein VHE35_05345 [Kofleriaceae bacterium]|nr:hypothetical protein [Kofleriaceae bacterium]